MSSRRSRRQRWHRLSYKLSTVCVDAELLHHTPSPLLQPPSAPIKSEAVQSSAPAKARQSAPLRLLQQLSVIPLLHSRNQASAIDPLPEPLCAKVRS